MTRRHVFLKFAGLLFVLISALALTPAFSVPSINVNVQPIGACTAERYYIDVNITNLEGRPLTNQTFNVTIPADRIPAYSKLKAGNVYVVDENGKPLYYWVMRKTSKVFTVFFRVPYIDANGWKVVRIYYGSRNHYRGYRKPTNLFVYFESFSRLKNYSHVNTGIFPNSKSFQSGELRVSRNRLVIDSTISTGLFPTAKEAQLTTLRIDGSYDIVFKFRRGSNAQSSNSYPFYMFVYAKVGNTNRYDYIGIHESNSAFYFEFGDNRGRTYETSAKAGKQYYLGRILVSPHGSSGSVEKFSNGALVDSYSFKNKFGSRDVSVGFGQANADFFTTVNLLAYVDWVYIVKHVNYDVRIVGMGAECSCN
ncbi:DUF2341 domain-containing protein [Thermococcus stetteri]|uniref:DUF2341 domain-containing protein n=1 Tax=Thermococcus stetteri TaxID=49900 RepID=UPI001AE9D797|nr:DUF2341 domain-containing protein [Thermococcus stetteri]MBP1911361.1 hypothetical protein [Thermococcus stetteri]